jgi:hypothetical protein
LTQTVRGRCSVCAGRVGRPAPDGHRASTELPDLDTYTDVNALTGALKSYLRDLPDKLLTGQASAAWVTAARTPSRRPCQGAARPTHTAGRAWTCTPGCRNTEQRVQALRAVLWSLPVVHRETTIFLFAHLRRCAPARPPRTLRGRRAELSVAGRRRRVADEAHVNKMNEQNLGTVFGPTLFEDRPTGRVGAPPAAAELALATFGNGNDVVEQLLRNWPHMGVA